MSRNTNDAPSDDRIRNSGAIPFSSQIPNDSTYDGDSVGDVLSGIDQRLPDSIIFTPEGGLAIKVLNKTGSASVKGSLVMLGSSVDNSVVLSIPNSLDCVGVVYTAGVADGSYIYIVVIGIADVLLKDGTTSTRGNWVKASDAAGRADATNASAPGAVLSHFYEIGHCLESHGSGTDVLCKIMMHYN